MFSRHRVARLCHALLVFAFVSSTACAPTDYQLTENVSYNAALGIYGTMDMYEPLHDTTQTLRPAIIAIHGGAWRSGDKAWGDSFGEELAPFGYVVFSINYRLSGNPNGKWPAQIQDVQEALRFIRANASRFRIDPERIASLGMSAGGHLATMLALRGEGADRVKVAVNLDGEHDMTMPPEEVMADFVAILASVFGHPGPWSEGELRDISTVTFVRRDVSLLSIHGTGDDNVYFPQSQRITNALQAKGASAHLVPVDGANGDCHEDCWTEERARKTLHQFLDRELRHDGNAYYLEFTGRPSPFQE